MSNKSGPIRRPQGFLKSWHWPPVWLVRGNEPKNDSHEMESWPQMGSELSRKALSVNIFLFYIFVHLLTNTLCTALTHRLCCAIWCPEHTPDVAQTEEVRWWWMNCGCVCLCRNQSARVFYWTPNAITAFCSLACCLVSKGRSHPFLNGTVRGFFVEVISQIFCVKFNFGGLFVALTNSEASSQEYLWVKKLL